MKKNQILKIYTALSILILLFGVISLVYMIKVEDEPGALPLFLIILGTLSLIVNQVKIKKQMR
jgi:hypothetical protein